MSTTTEVHRACVVCKANKTPDGELLMRCSRCKITCYCSQAHQKADWKSHKKWCYALETKSVPRWWDKDRSCEKCGKKHPWKMSCDHSVKGGPKSETHDGQPEIIIWYGNKDGVKTGWGASMDGDGDKFRKKFEEEFGCDEEKLAMYRPSAFRWTCCGNTLDSPYPCDHHGRGRTPCTCDFCTGGMAVPLTSRPQNMRNYGLDLHYGPDPRSYNPALGTFNLVMNQMFNGDLSER